MYKISWSLHGGGEEGDKECGYRCRVPLPKSGAGVGDAMRWSRSESGKCAEDHGGGGLRRLLSFKKARFTQLGDLGELGGVG